MAAYNLKEAKDVKEYLNNIFVEYNFGCYSEKSPEACHLLGDYFEAIDRDYKKAGDIYKNNCDNFSYPRSCAKIGGYIYEGKGCERNLVEAFEYLKKGCELNDKIGCTNAGIVAVGASPLHKKDKSNIIKDGVKMLDKACHQFESDKACHFLASIYFTGIKDIIEKDYPKAYKAALIACDTGNPYACANVSHMLKSGDGTEKNMELAETYRQRAQDLQEARLRGKPKNREIKFGDNITPE